MRRYRKQRGHPKPCRHVDVFMMWHLSLGLIERFISKTAQPYVTTRYIAIGIAHQIITKEMNDISTHIKHLANMALNEELLPVSIQGHIKKQPSNKKVTVVFI